MSKTTKSLLAAASLLGCAIALPQAHAAANDPMTRDMILLTEWFEGRWDSEEQTLFEKAQGEALPEDEHHRRVHTIHKRVDLPQFGENVFYVEQYLDHDPENIYRQRIVIFSTDGETRQVRMASPAIKNGEAYRGAYKDPALLADLTYDDLIFFEGCDVFWRRNGGQFEGEIGQRECVFGEGEERRYSVYKLWLSPDKYWFVDSSFLVADDSLHVGHPVDSPYELNRALPFECSMYFYYSSVQSSAQIVPNLEVHSQGGTASAVRESDGKRFEILMRDKEYPFFGTRPDFIFLALREEGEELGIAFASTDPDARSVGVREKSVGGFCNRVGYDFREPAAVLPK